MSGSPSTAPPSPPTSPQPASSPDAADNPPVARRLSRRSPPPPKLNLDGCSTPLLSTTTTNTSTNAASNPSRAFVFTSSRTIRTLHGLSHSADDARPPPSPLVGPPSPVSTPGSVKSGKQTRSLKVPALSPAQLAKHSMGALDARCIVSPSMRAAGFVPLSQASAHHPPDPSTPLPSPIPTPSEPPHFPPIVFVNPTNVATSSLWNYQRTLSYGLPSKGSDYPTYDNKPIARPAVHPVPQGKEGSDSSSSSFIPDVSSSSPSLFSNPSSSRSSVTSISPYSQSESDEQALALRLEGLMLPGHSTDGYPFPVTPPRSRTQSARAPSTSRVSAMTASPSVSSKTITPTVSPTVETTALPGMPFSSMSESVSSSSGNHTTSPVPPSVPMRSSSSRHASQLSIAELCLSSPNVWLADPSHIVPRSFVGREEAARGRNRTASRWIESGSGRGAEAGTEIAALADAPGEGGKVAAAAVGEAKTGAVATVDGMPERLPSLTEVSQEEDEIAKEKEKGKGKEKEKEKARRRHTAKLASTRSRSPPSMDSSPTSTTPSPPRTVAKERVRSKGKDRADRSDRSRSTKSKAIGPTPTFSTWSLIPPSSRDKRASASRPHILGAADPIMDRERKREAGQFAKDVVIAHREHDREYARQGPNHRVSNKMRIASAPTDEYTTVYDASHGRGLGRGERGGGRGRGRSARSLALSVLSEGDTMVQSETSSTMDAIEVVIPA